MGRCLLIYQIIFMSVNTNTNFQSYLDKSVSYPEYLAAFDKAIKENTMLAEAEQVPLFKYYGLNYQRSTRIYNQYTVTDALQEALTALPHNLHWLVITEPWCGDSAQNLPIIAKVAEASNGKINLRIVYRDANVELIDRFLTNGGRAIPKLLQLTQNQEINTTWGPRPAAAQKLVMELKAANIAHDDYIATVHKWYADNKAQSLSTELVELINKANQ